MSTLVVVRKGNQVAIAADTQSTAGYLKMLSRYEKANDKIFEVKNTFIGFVGSSATKLVFENLSRRKKFKADFSSREHIFETFIKLHPKLKSKYFINPKDEEDDPFESSQVCALMANAHGIFGVYSLREVFEYDRFWAVGSGQDFALGAMYSRYDDLESAEEIARIGVTAGCEFDKHSSLPFTMYSVQLATGDTDEKNQ